MSERDRNDDFNEPQFELGGVETDETKNRPAVGAAFAESTQELDLDWKGSSAATDFLGIDGDARTDEIPAPIGSALDTSGTAGLPADSWLHGIEDREQADAQPAHALEADPEQGAIAPAEGPRRRAHEPKSSSRMLILAASCMALALAGGGAWYWKTQRPGHTAPTPVEVATKPTPAKPEKPVAKDPTAPTKPAPGGVAPKPVVETPTDTVPVDPITEPAVVVANDPASDPGTLPTLPEPVVSVTPTITFPEPAVTDTTPNTTPTPGATSTEPVSLPTTLRVPPPSTTPIPGAVRRATEEDFANLWREQSVPLEAIAGERRLRTINVGQVRVMLDSGEYFEGGLYAVGQNRVWLDLDLGRIAFEAASVRDITRISRPASATGKKGQDLSGLPHVEVRLPGGWMAGRLVGREGNTVTLVTDTGIRMVIESDDVRPITARRTRVLGTVAKLGGFTGNPAEAAKKP